MLVPGEAHAGTMVLYSCHTPSGRIVGTSGWNFWADNAVPLPRTGNTCATGRNGTLALEVGRASGGHPDHERRIGWTFYPAANTSIGAFTAYVCGVAYTHFAGADIRWTAPVGALGGYSAQLRDFGPYVGCQGSAPWWEHQGNGMSAANLSAPNVEFSAYCYVWCDEGSARSASMDIASFRAEIRDGLAPAATAASGTMTTTGIHTGKETVRFAAADVGVGLFRAIAEARPRFDGPWLQMNETVLGPSSCRPLGETSYLYEFDSPQPCPGTLSEISLTMDNDRLPPGKHDMRVVVEDAAGNRTVVYHPKEYEVAAAPPAIVPAGAPGSMALANGTGASRVAQIRITVPGTSRLPSSGPFRLAGRLRDAESNPISGATLSVQSRPYLPKADVTAGEWVTVGTAVTDAKGVFRARLPAGPSRAIRVTYQAYGNDSHPSAIATAEVAVPAQVSVTVKRSRIRNGSSAIVRGRVAGPLPSGGALVGLEAREPGRWVPVATTRRWVKTSPTGAFTLRYRFRRTFTPTTYRFRVVVSEDSDFQYARGVSRSISVRVRP